jgi:diguanylate cyclase (GGDEF)-like protein/PAS domain S-box-containing protein
LNWKELSQYVFSAPPYHEETWRHSCLPVIPGERQLKSGSVTADRKRGAPALKTHLFDDSILATTEAALNFITNILDSSTTYSIIGKAMDGTIVLWNEGARRLYGYEAEEVVGKLNAALLHAPQEVLSGRPRQILDAALQDGKWEGTVQRVRRNGEQFSARVVVTPRFDSSGKPIGFLLISKDISEELRLAAQLESANKDLREQIAHRQEAETTLLHTQEAMIAHAREMEEIAFQMRQLTEMTDLLQSCASSDETRQVAKQALHQFFPEEAGIIYLSTEPGGLLEIFTSWNIANLIPNERENFEPHECWALRRGRPHVIGIDSAALKCSHLQDREHGGSICVPMMARGQSFGVFLLAWTVIDSQSSSPRHAFRQSQAVGVAHIIALAISNVRLREALKEQTIRDPLTGLYNRRYLEDSLHREICRAQRSQSSIGIIMIDIDNFKQFNDTFGHAMGDQMLRALGVYLKALVRPEDIPSRYGGEEFTLVLPGASSEIVRERAEKLRNGFRNVPSSFGLALGNAIETLSLSVGVSVFPEHGDSVKQVLKAADQALYEAKTNGKDRVMLAVKAHA